MFRTFLAACVAAAATLAANPVFAVERFHAPSLAPSVRVELPAPGDKRSGATIAADGRLQIGFVRALDKSVSIPHWNAAEGGYVARIEASSPDAQGLRVKLDLGTVPGAFEVRAAGSDGVVQSATLDPLLANEFWTPWTPGETQSIEIFSRVAPSPDPSNPKTMAAGPTTFPCPAPANKTAGPTLPSAARRPESN